MKLFLLLLFMPVFLLAQTPLEQSKKLWEENKREEAVKILEKIPKSGRDYADARYYLGRYAYENKEYDDAIDFFQEAIETNDKKSEYYTWLGDTYGTMAGSANVISQGFMAPKMKSAWEKAIALDAQNLPARQSLIQYYLQAPSIMGGSTEKAMDVANQILKIKPAEGHRQMGLVYLHEKKSAEAEKEFILMANADPLYESALINYYLGQNQYNKAFALIEKTLSKDPENYLAIYQFGRASAISGQRLNEGEAYLKKYLLHTPLNNEPSLAGANMRLAMIQEKRGNKAEAKRLYQVALTMDASLKDAKDGLARVSK
ncbi:MAG: tetratricopeptide repeat protein [Flammeovirgaceae bacterium]|nr:tetratricopeptide repeat protein [Flammeovirgaceae bacterium]